MEYQQAKSLISEFISIIGRISPTYDNGIITGIVITFTNPALVESQLFDLVRQRDFPSIESDKNIRTLGALINGDRIVSLRTLIEEDKVQGLIEKAKLLDYIDWHPNQ
jgi:hypothetical protein